MASTTEITEKLEVTLSSLPLSIQNQIPYSIRTRKDKYTLLKLPINIQYLVKDYLQEQKSVTYDVIFDATPDIVTTGDFNIIDNYFDLAVEYLKNYLMLAKGQYPFDPLFYSKLKYYVQTKDTSTQYTLVNNEVNRIAGVVATDLNIPIQVVSIVIDKTDASGNSTTYHVSIILKVNNETKTLGIEVL
jgi:hypothetical protein